MDWRDELKDIVSRYTGAGGGTAAAPADTHKDFQQVVQTAPQGAVAEGLAHAFRSDQTAPFPEMVANLFRQSNGEQRAGLLNRLLGFLGPEAAPELGGPAGRTVSPQQTEQISADQVRQIAARAQDKNPSVIDEVSGFYAQHPDLVKAMGTGALILAVQHILRRGQGG